ncbi:MAG: FAD-binding protein [Firmicutes bacterium]|nr:FAD-binding protein [Bacillota bacterium]
MQYSKLVDKDIAYLESLVGDSHILVGDDILEDYAHDELGEARAFPEVVVEPDSTEAVAAIMRYAYEKNIPVTTRGSGTGLCGGCVPLQGGILLSTARLNRILEIDTDNLMATVEPGVILLDFQETVEKMGFLYAPDPGERSATIGGNVATNAGGMRAVKYGVTRDHVTGMEVVLPNGDVVQLGGKIAKNSSGYSLLHLMIGSEGTLGIMTKIIVKLLPLPRKVLSLLVPFSCLEQAIGTVPKIIRSRIIPQAMEFMERDVILSAEKYLGKVFPHKTAPAYLLLRFDGNNLEELEEIYEIAGDICLEAGAEDVLIADTPERQEGIWDARGAFLEALKAESDMDEVDVVVPRDKIAIFINYTKELEREYGIMIRSFGHAGDGNMHVYILRDDMDEDIWRGKVQEIMDLLYAKGKELGGQVSGEHGIGISKRQYLIDDLGDTLIALQRQIKGVFDPKNILNPGKLIYSLGVP